MRLSVEGSRIFNKERKDLTETRIDSPRWDLGDLYTDPADPRIEAALTRAGADAEAFAERYKGRIVALAMTAGELAAALTQYEALQQEVAKPGNYAGLLFAAEASEANGAFYQRIRERTTEATLPLIFFDLELMGADEERLKGLRRDPALARFGHYLDTVRAFAPFRLSEPEERVLEEQRNTARRAFVRLYEEITSNLRFPMEGHETPLTLSEVLDLQYEADRATRRRSAEALTAGLETQARTLGFILNTLAQDKATEDRLRGHAYPEETRHLGNELAPETVETVMRTATRGYPLVARYYEAKRRLLGLDRLAHYDRYAPVTQDEAGIAYGAARDMILAAFDSFDSGYRAAAAAFFEGQWIDAEARPGKRGGAFCSYVTPDTHPYVFLNYLGKPGDVRTLAHELGHGVHSFLARGQRYLDFHGTLPMAEVASTFAEMLVFDTQAGAASDAQRLSLYAEQIEQSIATIFRQAALYRFEQAVHQARRSSGELTVERLGALWQEHIGMMFGASVTLEPGHALWWSYVRHFIASPFYVYAYTFGEMLALALYRKYQEEGPGFAPRYIAMLAAGGSKSPAELVAPLGVDLNDGAFWQGALEVLEAQVAQFETLAARPA